MANYYAIAAVSAALQGSLIGARPPELGNASIEICNGRIFKRRSPLKRDMTRELGKRLGDLATEPHGFTEANRISFTNPTRCR